MIGIIDSGQKIVTNGLVLHLDAAQLRSYPGSGTTWSDLSGNNYNGTLTNGPTFNSANGGSIVLDGVNDYVNLGTFTNFGSSNRSVEVWFRILSLPISGYDRIIAFPADDTSTDTPAFTIGFGNTTSNFSIGFGGTPYNGYLSLPAFSLSTWLCVVGTIQGNVINGYLNGNFIAQATNTGTVATNPIGYIGRYNNFYGQYGNADISNVKIYNRALSAAEIQQNYNATKSRYGL